MNTLEETRVISPYGEMDDCAKFVIDEPGIDYVVRDVMPMDDEYTLGFWIRASTATTIVIFENTITVTSSWRRHVITRESTERDLRIKFNGACEFYFFNTQLERGNKDTTFNVNSEDMDKHIARVEVEADKINFIVASGTNASNFTLTDRTADLVANYINLKGLVTFSGLDTGVKDEIDGAKDEAAEARSRALEALAGAASATNTADQALSTANKAELDVTVATNNAIYAVNVATNIDALVNNNKANWDRGGDWVTNMGTSMEAVRDMVSVWANGAISKTTSINGGWIDTNTITADKIAIGDFVNTATVNPNNAETMIPDSGDGTMVLDVKNDRERPQFGRINTTAGWIPLCRRTPIDFSDGDEYYFSYHIGNYEYTAHSFNIELSIYDSSGTYISSAVGNSTTIAARGWGDVSGTIKIPDGFITAEARTFMVAIHTPYSVGLSDVYVKKKNSGQLLVDGTIAAAKIAADAITTSKIAANAVTANKIVAGAITADKIAAGAITASKIATNTITADKIAVGDFTNIVTVNPNNANTMIPDSGDGTQISGTSDLGHPQFKRITTTAGWIPLCRRSPIDFVNGDEFYFTYHAGNYSTSAGSLSMSLAIYDENGVYINIATGNSTTIAAKGWGTVSGVIRIPSGFITSDARQFMIAIHTTLDIGISDISLRKRNSGHLLVDGTITATQIAANTITADKLDVSSLSAISANLGTVYVGGINNSYGTMTVLNSVGGTEGIIDYNGFRHYRNGSYIGRVGTNIYSNNQSRLAADYNYENSDGFEIIGEGTEGAFASMRSNHDRFIARTGMEDTTGYFYLSGTGFILRSLLGENDWASIYTVGTGDNGSLWICTGDNGNEPIWFAQCTGTFTSAVRHHWAQILDERGRTVTSEALIVGYSNHTPDNDNKEYYIRFDGTKIGTIGFYAKTVWSATSDDVFGLYNWGGSKGIFDYTNDGQLRVWSYVNFNAGTNISSTEKIKTNIEPYGNTDEALQNIMDTDFYTYSLKSDIADGYLDYRNVGVIVERKTAEIFKSRDGDGINIYTMASTAMLAVKELKRQLDIAEIRIEELESKLYN